MRCTIAFHCSKMASLSDWTSGQYTNLKKESKQLQRKPQLIVIFCIFFRYSIITFNFMWVDGWQLKNLYFLIWALKTFHVVALLLVFFIVWKCPVKILTVTSNQMSTLNTITWNYVVILNKSGCYFRGPAVNFRQTRLLLHHLPGLNCVLFCKVNARQPW